jgi:hypothetical protein
VTAMETAVPLYAPGNSATVSGPCPKTTVKSRPINTRVACDPSPDRHPSLNPALKARRLSPGHPIRSRGPWLPAARCAAQGRGARTPHTMHAVGRAGARCAYPPTMHTVGRAGARCAYHYYTFGWLVGGLIQHVAQRSLRDVLRHDPKPLNPPRPAKPLNPRNP